MRIVLYAVSTPHASEVLETVRRLGWEVAAVVRNMPDLPVPFELPGAIEAAALTPDLLAIDFAVPQTDPVNRYLATLDARRAGFRSAATVIDPTAIVAASAHIDAGCYVGAGAVIGAGARLGEGCLVNRSCSVAHHVVLGAYATTGPGVVIAGSCRIDQGAFLGAGSVLAPERRIGAGAAVGAGAVVVRDVAPRDMVAGNPARVVRGIEVPPGVPWGG